MLPLEITGVLGIQNSRPDTKGRLRLGVGKKGRRGAALSARWISVGILVTPESLSSQASPPSSSTHPSSDNNVDSLSSFLLPPPSL